MRCNPVQRLGEQRQLERLPDRERRSIDMEKGFAPIIGRARRAREPTHHARIEPVDREARARQSRRRAHQLRPGQPAVPFVQCLQPRHRPRHHHLLARRLLPRGPLSGRTPHRLQRREQRGNLLRLGIIDDGSHRPADTARTGCLDIIREGDRDERVRRAPAASQYVDPDRDRRIVAGCDHRVLRHPHRALLGLILAGKRRRVRGFGTPIGQGRLVLRLRRCEPRQRQSRGCQPPLAHRHRSVPVPCAQHRRAAAMATGSALRPVSNRPACTAGAISPAARPTRSRRADNPHACGTRARPPS